MGGISALCRIITLRIAKLEKALEDATAEKEKLIARAEKLEARMADLEAASAKATKEKPRAKRPVAKEGY